MKKALIPILFVFTSCQNNPAPVVETAETSTQPTEKIAEKAAVKVVPEKATADTVKPNTATAAHRFVAGGFDNDAAVLVFITSLQKNVAAAKKDAVADMVNYPMSLNQTNGSGKPKRTEIKDKAAFLAKYDQIISEKLKMALKNQDMKDIFARDQGVMLGNGDIWLAPDSKTKKIGVVAVNK